jgi:hypothetical protein
MKSNPPSSGVNEKSGRATSLCSRRFRPETWAAEVSKMVKVIGQPISDDVRPVIIKYLQTHLTPQTRKPWPLAAVQSM